MKPPNVIYVDVDGTLIIRGKVNERLIEWMRLMHGHGSALVVWSARGEQWAVSAVERADIADIVDHVLSKPGLIIDDTKRVLPMGCRILNRIPKVHRRQIKQKP